MANRVWDTDDGSDPRRAVVPLPSDFVHDEPRWTSEVVREGGGWAVIVNGLPVHGDGVTLELAVADALEALREYAMAWHGTLRLASNHASNRLVVNQIDRATDDELRDLLMTGAGPGVESGGCGPT